MPDGFTSACVNEKKKVKFGVKKERKEREVQIENEKETKVTLHILERNREKL